MEFSPTVAVAARIPRLPEWTVDSCRPGGSVYAESRGLARFARLWRQLTTSTKRRRRRGALLERRAAAIDTNGGDVGRAAGTVGGHRARGDVRRVQRDREAVHTDS